jgi:ATP-binding cassette, subfamily C (CFTR/MRP), member 1
MLGFTNIMSGIVQALRVTELHLSTRFRKLLLVRVLLANSIATIAPLATFVIFVIVGNSTGKELDTAASFTALSLISLLTEPMNALIRAIPELNGSMACFSRIQAFLNSGTRMDHRLPLDNGADLTEERESNTSNSDIALKDLSPVLSPKGTSPIMVMRNASFGWDSGANPDVSDISFTVLRRQFCFIIGPVGSGKSTLLKGLLGETPSSQGFVYSNTRSIAYNDQSPWIQNGTIKQNILGVSSFEEPWYSQVIRVCALEVDISNLPKRHGKSRPRQGDFGLQN